MKVDFGAECFLEPHPEETVNHHLCLQKDPMGFLIFLDWVLPKLTPLGCHYSYLENEIDGWLLIDPRDANFLNLQQ